MRTLGNNPLTLLLAICFSSASLLSVPAYAETITFVCDWPTYSDMEGIHEVNEKYEATYILDTETGKAYLIGSNGSSEVLATPPVDGNISFIEITPGGYVMTTTITASLDSVHSRNSVMLGELIPSQYYGKCEIK
jgi:hypothetical protein